MRVLFTISEPCLLRLTMTEDERNGQKAWLLFQAGSSFYALSPTCRWDFLFTLRMFGLLYFAWLVAKSITL